MRFGRLGFGGRGGGIDARSGGFRRRDAARRRRGGIHVDRLLNFILDFAGRLLELLDALPKPFGELGKFLGAEEYFHFVLLFMVGMGISFEIPVLLLTLVRMGLIQHETITKGRPYLYTGIMVVCAFVTPDAFSTIFMVIPVIGLMEICILISAHWERQKKIAEATAAVAASKSIDSGA